MTPEEARARITELSNATWHGTALAAAVEAGLLTQLTGPRDVASLATATGVEPLIVRALLDVVVALGLVSREGDVYAPAVALGPLDAIRDDLRSTHLQSAELLRRARQGTLGRGGWDHTDPEILQAQGGNSRVGVLAMRTHLFPMLSGLLPALDAPGAAFLDVGTGVAGLAIAIAESWPTLRIVALEPQDAPAALARRNIDAAGLAHRIELRRQWVAALPERDSFDLAWVPVMFMDCAVGDEALVRVHAAVRPGAWAMTGATGHAGDSLFAAYARMRTAFWSGDVRTVPDIVASMERAGFVNVRAVPGPPGGMLNPIVGQKR